MIDNEKKDAISATAKAIHFRKSRYALSHSTLRMMTYELMQKDMVHKQPYELCFVRSTKRVISRYMTRAKHHHNDTRLTLVVTDNAVRDKLVDS